MITITPPTKITAHDKLTWAYSQINKAIELTDGGRLCSTPMWASVQDCRRSIREAMQLLRAEAQKAKAERKAKNGSQEIADCLVLAWQKAANHEQLTFEETNRLRAAMEAAQKGVQSWSKSTLKRQ